MKEGLSDDFLKALSVKGKSLDVMVAKHLISSIAADPLRKIRLICEAFLMRHRDEEMENIYAVATSLLSYDDQNRVAWSFSQTEENFERFIKPWLIKLPDFLFYNSLDRQVKIRKLVREEVDQEGNIKTIQKPTWEQFFVITSVIGVTDVALGEMRGMFVVYAMPIVMKRAGMLVEEIDPKAFLEAKLEADRYEKRRQDRGHVEF